MVAKIEDTPLMCIPLATTDREEKDSLWADLKAAFINLTDVRNGFRIRFHAPPALLEKIGRLISLERTCCQFLHIRLDVLPVASDGKEIMELSLTGRAGVKQFLASALATVGLPNTPVKSNNKWLTWGASGVLFGVICCVLPPLFLVLGMAGIANWFSVLDSVAGIIILISAVLLAYGIYKKRKKNQNCGPNC